MAQKHIKLSPDVLILFNKVKGKYTYRNYKAKRITDEMVIKAVLIHYLKTKEGGFENGRGKGRKY